MIPEPPPVAAPPPPPGAPPPPPSTPHARSRSRLALVCGAAGAVVVGAVLGWQLTRAASRGSVEGPAASGGVAAAIVNINGDVPDGRVAGTGMIVDARGLVLTNDHVVAGTTALTAQVGGGRRYRATVIGVDPTQDVALVRLEHASRMATVPVDPSGSLSVGDRVTGLGNALGLNGAPVAASGKVTTLDETIAVRDQADTIRETLNGMVCFDAPIQPGDSGGPLVNSAGKVIGMDTAGSITRPGIGARWGCAIPITRALDVMRQILRGAASPYIEGGHRGELGVVVHDAASGGARVQSVIRGGAAAGAGVTAGDVITAVGGIPVRDRADLDAAMQGRRPGDRLSIEWQDVNGVLHTATVGLGAGPPA